jgi:hypothetical protein
VVLADLQPAGARRQQTTAQLQQGGLTGAGGSEQADQLTGPDADPDPGQGGDVVALAAVDVHQAGGLDREAGHDSSSRIRG